MCLSGGTPHNTETPPARARKPRFCTLAPDSDNADAQVGQPLLPGPSDPPVAARSLSCRAQAVDGVHVSPGELKHATACLKEALDCLLGGANRVFLPVFIDDTKRHQRPAQAGRRGNHGVHAGVKRRRPVQMNGRIIAQNV